MAPALHDNGSSSITSTSSPLRSFSMVSLSPSLGSTYSWTREMKSEERGLYLIHLLLTCANQVASGNIESANFSLDQISQLSSPDGDTMQRIAAYFAGALADRVLRSFSGLHRALNATSLGLVSDRVSVQKLFFELCPFLKIAFVVTNQTILEAMDGEKVIHIIDLNPLEPAQWIALLQSFSSRSGGPPHLTITGVHPHRQVLDQMSHRLCEEAEKLDIPFQFKPIVGRLENLDLDQLRVKTGEAVAVSSVLQLHTLLSYKTVQKLGPVENDTASSPAGTPVGSPKLNNFLAGICGVSPKLLVVTEQDSNHNVGSLMDRMLQSLYYYAALFDCLESTMARSSLQRLRIEKMVYGEEIKNIVSCEGEERMERHEKLETWIRRLECAGFCSVPLSYYSLVQGRRVLQSYGCEGYRINDDRGCGVICWQDRCLFSVSSWRRK